MTEFKPQNMSVLSRLWHMSFGWGSVGLIYFTTWALQGQGLMLPETALDRMIPYSSTGIWLYLSFFILIPYTYLIVDANRVRWLARAMPLCAAVCGLIFVTYPTTLHYPSISNASFSDQVLHLLLATDSSQNCLPSLHAALTLLCVWALVDRRYRHRSILAVLLGLGICYSSFELRRHVSIDLAAGLLVGIMCGTLCMVLPFLTHKDRELLP